MKILDNSYKNSKMFCLFWKHTLLFTGLAWLIIPNEIGITSPSFTYNSWRIFLLICAAPSFVVAGLLLLLPESPKYLLSRGRYDEALSIFRSIYAINTGKTRESYKVNNKNKSIYTIQTTNYLIKNFNNSKVIESSK